MFQTTINKLTRTFKQTKPEGKDTRFKDEYEMREFYNGVHNLQQTLDLNDRFGFCNAKRSYVIAILYKDGSFRYVTSVDYNTKEFRYEWDKPAEFFHDSYCLEDLVCAMNANGFGAFIMTVPDYFNEDMFINPKEPKKED